MPQKTEEFQHQKTKANMIFFCCCYLKIDIDRTTTNIIF